MTVASEVTHYELSWTGVETVFAPGLSAQSAAHVVVTYRTALGVESTLTQGIHLNVAKAGAPGVTGAISATPIALPAAPGTLIFDRVTPATQVTPFVDLAAYAAQTHEKLHDAAALRAAEARYLLTSAFSWAPVMAIVNDGIRRVQQVVDWVGGTGVKPAVGKYIGLTGWVTAIASAADIRGVPGAAGPGSGNVVGPGVSVAGNIAGFAGTGGDVLQDLGPISGLFAAAVFAGEVDVASGAACNIGAAASQRVRLTGSSATTSFAAAINKLRIVRYAATPTLVHNPVSLILLGGVNRQVAADAQSIFCSDGAGNWRELSYQKANGTSLSDTVFNVISYGADPTGVADSTTAIQNAINAAAANGGYGGTIFFPPGNFRTTAVLTVSSTSIVFKGSGRLSSQLQGTGAAQAIINVTASYFEIDSMAVLGPTNTVMTGGTLITLTNAHGSKITNCYIANAFVALSLITSTNCLIQFNKVDNVYGTVSVNFGAGGGGNYVINNQFDSAYMPLATWVPSATLGAAWAGNTAYTLGQVRSNGGYYFACTKAGVSAAAGGPTLSRFGLAIVDGTAEWKLLAKTDYVILQNISAPQNYIAFNDLTAVCQYVISISGSDGTVLVGNQGGGAAAGFVNLGAGNTNITIADNYFTASNGFGIVDGAGSSQRVTIANNVLQSMNSTAISMGSTLTNILGNSIKDAGMVANAASIAIGANTTLFNVSNNIMTAGAGQSTAAGVQVVAGTSNKYNIMGNLFNGFATNVSDGGSGVAKTLSGNN